MMSRWPTRRLHDVLMRCDWCNREANWYGEDVDADRLAFACRQHREHLDPPEHGWPER